MKDDDIINPVQADGRYAGSLPFFGGEKIWEANPQIVDKLRDVGALFHATKYAHSYMHCWRHKTPIIYRATTQWFAGMDVVPGWHGHTPKESLRATALRGIDATAVLSGMGQGAPVRDDRQPPRLDAVAPAPMGRAAAVFRRQGNRPAASGYAGAARTRGGQGGTRRPRDLVRRDARGFRRRPGQIPQAHRHARRVVRLGLHLPDRDGRPRWPRDGHGLASERSRVPGGSLSRRLRPASRLVPLVAARLEHGQRRPAVQGAAHARLRRRRRGPEDVEVEGQRRLATQGCRITGRGNPALVGRRHRLLRRVDDLR